MHLQQEEDSGPFSTAKVTVITFLGAKVLFAIHTGPAIVGAILVGVMARRLPPSTRGKIRGTYSAAKHLVSTRVTATSVAAREIAKRTNARIRAKISNGVLVLTIWVAFTVEIANQIIETFKVSIEIWRTDGTFVVAAEEEVLP